MFVEKGRFSSRVTGNKDLNFPTREEGSGNVLGSPPNSRGSNHEVFGRTTLRERVTFTCRGSLASDSTPHTSRGLLVKDGRVVPLLGAGHELRVKDGSSSDPVPRHQ